MQAVVELFAGLVGREKAKQQTLKEKYRSFVHSMAATVSKGGKPNIEQAELLLDETGVSAEKLKNDVTAVVRLGELRAQQAELQAKSDTQRAIQLKQEDLEQRRRAALAEFAKEGDQLNLETQQAIHAYSQWQNNAGEINDLEQQVAAL